MYFIVALVLTVVALCAGVGGHGAVAGVVLPLLDTDAHVGTGVLLTCGARTCRSPYNTSRHPSKAHTQTEDCV